MGGRDDNDDVASETKFRASQRLFSFFPPRSRVGEEGGEELLPQLIRPFPHLLLHLTKSSPSR